VKDGDKRLSIMCSISSPLRKWLCGCLSHQNDWELARTGIQMTPEDGKEEQW
jgi:hypothetical protein